MISLVPFKKMNDLGLLQYISPELQQMVGMTQNVHHSEDVFGHTLSVIGATQPELINRLMALFHDIGKTRVPKEILNKIGKLLPEEWATIRFHPVIGAEIIMRMKEWGELSTRMIDGAFEHHLRYDLSGYPRLTRKRKITLFGRIITIADFYDALVRPRSITDFLTCPRRSWGSCSSGVGKTSILRLLKSSST
jgi:response regulator RpfG family c-di-GMP phosphodiesterase